MKSILFILAVLAAAVYLMAQTPKGSHLVEQYFPYQQVADSVNGSKGKVNEWLTENISENVTENATDIAHNDQPTAAQKENAETSGQPVTEQANVEVLIKRLQFLEDQVALLTQHQNGHRVGGGQTIDNSPSMDDALLANNPLSVKNSVSADIPQGSQQSNTMVTDDSPVHQTHSDEYLLTQQNVGVSVQSADRKAVINKQLMLQQIAQKQHEAALNGLVGN